MPQNNPPPAQPKREHLPVSQLDFDPHNPRFPPEVANGPVAELIERFVRDERLLEVLNSIADQGYFAGEPLLVVRQPPHQVAMDLKAEVSKSADGAQGGAEVQEVESRYFVIEGNRRLAALKLLNGLVAVPPGRPSIDEACENAKERPAEVPCLIFQSDDQILRYLGFRHITGIKSWGSLQKARYIKKLRDRFYADKPVLEQRTALAREIGSRADYVGAMLAALNLYERAERQNFYGVKGLDPNEIEFAVLTTALSYSNIASYVGLESRQDVEGAGVKDEELKSLLTWLFVARSGQKSVVGDSRNLSKLAAVVDSKPALEILLKDGELETAFQLSRGPALALNLALMAVERKLQEAWSWMPQVDSPMPGDEDVAESIRKRALDLREAIKSKRSEGLE